MLHEVFRVVSRFPRYSSCYMAEIWIAFLTMYCKLVYNSISSTVYVLFSLPVLKSVCSSCTLMYSVHCIVHLQHKLYS